ncbi:hypothetical protein LOD99_12839 [Oopsacas minuta]|uniref:Biogenesis of lysosome-related organelles complex 1 subunit 3 n=1 Tax=Oopsacas minuta TaxID=111878 RepID=A0AAV7JDG5_9METZ|nr:hypothetical protein LOD99_12839 [Oopsacas minuta]
MALVHGEDDESDTEDTTKIPPLKTQDKKEGVKGKLVDGEESETDDEDTYHDPEITHTEADIRVKGTNTFASSSERVGEIGKKNLAGDLAKLSETPQQKKLGDANRKLRKDITTSVLSTYQRALHKADQVGDQIGKSQQITGKCMDELKHTSIYLDRLSDILATGLNDLPQIRAISTDT